MIEGRLGNTIIGTFDASGDAQAINCPKGIKVIIRKNKLVIISF